MSIRRKRIRIWVDPKFQGRLVMRLGWYFGMYFLLTCAGMFLSETLMRMTGLESTSSTLDLQLQFLILLLILLPLLAFDLIRFSHRVVGPLHRFRKTILMMTRGEPVQEIKLRTHDLLEDHADALNALIRKWNELHANPPSSRRAGTQEDCDPLDEICSSHQVLQHQ